MEAKYIIVKDCVLDEVCMQAVSKQGSSSLNNVTFNFIVDFKAWRSRKAEELGFLKMPHDVKMHIPELAPVALVNNEYDLLIPVHIHDCRIPFILNSI